MIQAEGSRMRTTMIDTLRGLKTLTKPTCLALAALASASGLLACAQASNTPKPQPAFAIHTIDGDLSEDQLRSVLVGKTLYLRAGYQDNNLSFDIHGQLTGHSPQGSFTLSQVQINQVKLSKRKLELVGDRYALHFLGAAPFEAPTAATDRVKITPKKKSVRLIFEREQVEKPKKDKKENKKAKQPSQPSNALLAGNSATDQEAPNPAPSASAQLAPTKAQATDLLLAALDKVLSVGIDERMIAAMPDFWKVYYQSSATNSDFKPADGSALRQGTVDQKAKLLSAIEPSSNEYAQANGVAGMALYHAVVGSDGKVEEIVAGRPIGFGLDESAEQTIRKAAFQPAIKDGKPVAVALDLVVSFRIYSKRTSQPVIAGADPKPAAPAMPGLYTVLALGAAPSR